MYIHGKKNWRRKKEKHLLANINTDKGFCPNSEEEVLPQNVHTHSSTSQCHIIGRYPPPPPLVKKPKYFRGFSCEGFP
jgi:hypothetical protein